jgi:hypothetical protein
VSEALNGLAAVGVKRNPMTVMALSLATCGLYALWWGYAYGLEIKSALGRDDLNVTQDALLALPTCGLWGVYAFAYKYPLLLVEMQRRVGLPRNDIAFFTLLLTLAFFPAACFMIQTELNKIWDAAA